MAHLSDRVEALLRQNVAGPAGATSSDLVEILFASWEEMHREALPLRARVAQLEEALRPFANLGSIQNAGDWINAGHVVAARAAVADALCANCDQPASAHTAELGFGLVCPTDQAARTENERFTYTIPSEIV